MNLKRVSIFASAAVLATCAMGEQIVAEPDALLDYIQATGAQYIDTGVNAETGLKASIDFAWATFSGNPDWSLLDAATVASSNDNRSRIFMCHMYSGKPFFAYGRKQRQNPANSVSFVGGQRCEIITDMSSTNSFELTQNGVNTFDAFDRETFATNGIVNLHLNLFVFATNYGGSPSWKGQGRLYEMKIFRKNATTDEFDLLRHYLPCIKDHRVGLYDKVNGTISFSAGSADFYPGLVTNVVVIDDHPIPLSWLMGYPALSNRVARINPSLGDARRCAQLDAIVRDGAANARFKIWECYIANIDPTDPAADFRASITMENGVPHIGWSPNFENDPDTPRAYSVKVADSLADAALGSWRDYAQGSYASTTSGFFKVVVSLPSDIVPPFINRALTWNGGSTAWTAYDGKRNWLVDDGTTTDFHKGDSVTFTAKNAGTVTLSEYLQVPSMTVNGGEYTFEGDGSLYATDLAVCGGDVRFAREIGTYKSVLSGTGTKLTLEQTLRHTGAFVQSGGTLIVDLGRLNGAAALSGEGRAELKINGGSLELIGDTATPEGNAYTIASGFGTIAGVWTNTCVSGQAEGANVRYEVLYDGTSVHVGVTCDEESHPEPIPDPDPQPTPVP